MKNKFLKLFTVIFALAVFTYSSPVTTLDDPTLPPVKFQPI